MGRLIPLTARTAKGETFAIPRVVYLQENNIAVGSRTQKRTGLFAKTAVEERLNGNSRHYQVYESAIQVEAARNLLSTDLLIKGHLATGLSGTGTTQGAGTVLAGKYFNEITTLAAASAEAFLMPAATLGKLMVFQNNHATAAAKLFPASTEKINGAAANAVYSLPANSRVHLVCLKVGEWTVAQDYGA